MSNKYAKWEYHRFHDDSFLLVCRANCSKKDLDTHPSILAFKAAVEGAHDPENRANNLKKGHPAKPTTWNGKFTLGGEEFRIPAIYAFRKFFGLVCDPVGNTHSREAMERVVEALNAGIE